VLVGITAAAILLLLGLLSLLSSPLLSMDFKTQSSDPLRTLTDLTRSK
jgi:hypothetical protein